MPLAVRSSTDLCWTLLAALICVAGCGEPEIPRVKSSISEEILALPALYRTTGGKDVLAPGNAGDSGMVVLDENSGEYAWRVWECHNPTCSGKTGEGPTLFICPDPNYRFLPADEIEPGTVAGTTVPQLYCPHCTQQSPSASNQPSASSIRPHVLPETAASQAALEEELQVRIDHVNDRKKRHD